MGALALKSVSSRTDSAGSSSSAESAEHARIVCVCGRTRDRGRAMGPDGPLLPMRDKSNLSLSLSLSNIVCFPYCALLWSGMLLHDHTQAPSSELVAVNFGLGTWNCLADRQPHPSCSGFSAMGPLAVEPRQQNRPLSGGSGRREACRRRAMTQSTCFHRNHRGHDVCTTSARNNNGGTPLFDLRWQ